MFYITIQPHPVSLYLPKRNNPGSKPDEICDMPQFAKTMC